MGAIPHEERIQSDQLSAHNNTVREISERVKEFHAAQKPFRLFHGSTNSTRKSDKTRNNTVDTSQLDHVIHVDPSTRMALVEPNVSMAKLLNSTMQHGLLPPVVMEFPGITAGGGFSGTSAESSSFKYGFFDRTVHWIEIVCANGDIVTASAEENSDLFFGAASSFGTLGVTVLLQIRLIEAQPYVALSYVPVSSISQALDVMDRASKDDSTHYVDGIFYSKTKGVICTGKLTSSPQPAEESKSSTSQVLQRFSQSSDPWFYLRAEDVVSKGSSEDGPQVDLIPVSDYLFRYDRGGFWVARYSFKYFFMPFNRITRYLLDSLLHTSTMYHALHKSDLAQSYLIQDVAVPYDAAEDLFDFIDAQWGRYPIWLCPLLQAWQPPLFGKGAPSTSPMTSEQKETTRTPNMVLNFGIWGPYSSPRTPGYFSRRPFVDMNRSIERKVHEAGGQKCLYAHAYYTEDEFWEVYDKKQYDALRDKWNAAYLPSIWDKVKVDVDKEEREMRESWLKWLWYVLWSIWPLAGVYGVLHTILRKDYLLKRR